MIIFYSLWICSLFWVDIWYVSMYEWEQGCAQYRGGGEIEGEHTRVRELKLYHWACTANSFSQ